MALSLVFSETSLDGNFVVDGSSFNIKFTAIFGSIQWLQQMHMGQIHPAS